MLTLQAIKANPQYIIERLAVKGFDAAGPINKILELDAERRRLQQKSDSDASKLKKLAASIGALMKQGKKEEAEQAKSEVAALKSGQKGIQDLLVQVEDSMREVLAPVLPGRGLEGRIHRGGTPLCG